MTVDERFSWVRGFDIAGLHAMLSMPLVWNEQVVGALNVQTTAIRDFEPEEIEFLATIAALLAGIVEKGRMQAEAEAQLDRLSQLDAARAELLAVVTHELRTPLAVVRAYVDLLADAAAANAGGPPVDEVENWRAGATDQVTRLDRLVDSILASVRGEGLTGLRREPFDVVSAIDRTVGTLALLLRTRAVRWYSAGLRDGRPGRRDALPPGAGAPARQRGEVRAARAGRLAGRVADRRGDPGLHHRRRARASRSRTGRRCSSPTCASTGCGRAARGSGCSRPAG